MDLLTATIICLIISIPFWIAFALFIFFMKFVYMKNVDTRNRYIHNSVKKLVKSGKNGKAIKLLKETISKYPSDYFLYNEMGLFLVSEKKYSESIHYFQEAYRLNSNDTASLVNISWVYNKLNNFNEALTYAENALKVNKSDKAALVNKGDALMGLSMYQEAYECFDSVIELDRHYAYGYFGFGIACFRLEKFEEARKSFEQYVKFVPKDIDAYSYLIACYNHNEDFSRQVEMCDKIISINNSIPWVYCSKGNALCFLDDFQGAIDSFNKAIELDPQYADAHYFRSRILALFRHGDEAMASLKEAVRLDEKFKQRALDDEVLNNIKVFREFRDIIS